MSTCAWNHCILIIRCGLKVSPGGTPKKIGRGCAARFLKPLPYFRSKYVIFPTLFQTWPLKFSGKCPPFKAKMAKIYTLFQTSRQNIPNFRPKWSKYTPVFRPKRLKNHTLWRKNDVPTPTGKFCRWVPLIITIALRRLLLICILRDPELLQTARYKMNYRHT